MAYPQVFAAATLAKAAKSRTLRGAAGALGAQAAYAVGRGVGTHSAKRAGVSALRSSGLSKRKASKAMGAAMTKPASTRQQAANVATSPLGAAGIGAAGAVGVGHWVNQPRDSRGRWT